MELRVTVLQFSTVTLSPMLAEQHWIRKGLNVARVSARAQREDRSGRERFGHTHFAIVFVRVVNHSSEHN